MLRECPEQSKILRDRAKLLRNQGLSYRKIGKELGKCYSTIYSWMEPTTARKQKLWASNNPDKIKGYQKKYRQSDKYKKNHRLQMRELRKTEKSKEYRRKYARQYQRDRREHDLGFKLRCLLRTRLCHFISGAGKSGSAVTDLGCSIEELKVHLELQFQDGMTWENHGEWHIDHIKPLCSFDLSDREQLLQACNYTNLQPLWAADNLSKGSAVSD